MIPGKDVHILQVKMEKSGDDIRFIYYKDNVQCTEEAFLNAMEPTMEAILAKQKRDKEKNTTKSN